MDYHLFSILLDMVLSPTFNNRSDSAPTGTVFFNSIFNIPPGLQREELFLEQLQSGNIPNFMQRFVEVAATDNTNTLIYNVSSDVLCIGSDADYVRVPLYPHTAKLIADQLNCILPTDTMSRQIWQYADLKLTPAPKGPPYDQSMQLSSTFAWHNQIINQQINNQSYFLLTGHKKDIIIHPGLRQYPNNVCIYGWWYPNGQGIQIPPQFSAHNKYYSDYSHSARLINRQATLNGQEVDLIDILKNPQYAHLISDEGSFDPTAIYS